VRTARRGGRRRSAAALVVDDATSSRSAPSRSIVRRSCGRRPEQPRSATIHARRRRRPRRAASSGRHAEAGWARRTRGTAALATIEDVVGRNATIGRRARLRAACRRRSPRRTLRGRPRHRRRWSRRPRGGRAPGRSRSRSRAPGSDVPLVEVDGEPPPGTPAPARSRAGRRAVIRTRGPVPVAKRGDCVLQKSRRAVVPGVGVLVGVDRVKLLGDEVAEERVGERLVAVRVLSGTYRATGFCRRCPR